ncbi:major capsid protein E [Weissella confusa]|uniref:major capsid protein n=1 Tax=Weissella confusa TaxID=1583 RepID=UPI00107FD000|nr:major capsid protein [Weissella confusa]TGE65242.1 major capsid protein E [Weissella confusa]
MATDILDLFPHQDVLDYTKTVQTPNLLGAELFPARKVQSNDIKVLTSGTTVPVIAHVHAFDTEAEIGDRTAQVSETEPFFIKKKMILKEDDLVKLRTPRTPEEQSYIMNTVYDDLGNVVRSIDAATELMRMQALMTGVINVKDQMGGSYKVDYGIDSSQKGTADFADATKDPIEQIMEWAQSVTVTPTRAIMSQKALYALRKNPNVVANIFGSNNGRTVMQSDLDEFMQANGLPVLRAYTGKYADVDKKGKQTVTNYIADNQFAMFADNAVGETVYGLTPEEARAVAAGDVESSQIGNMFADRYEETHDPIRSVIKVSTMVVPTLAQADNIFQATVL